MYLFLFLFYAVFWNRGGGGFVPSGVCHGAPSGGGVRVRNETVHPGIICLGM